jgi:ribonucleoside-triphosphate reductase
MSDRGRIEARIAELRGELSRAEGTPTEVYSRIVGYYRSVRNWNAGKREEYGQRLVFGMPARGDTPARERAPEGVMQAGGLPEGDRRAADPASLPLPGVASLRDGVIVFTRGACPNCPPVANYVVASGIRAVFVDVDGDDGLALARGMGVMATPTVLGLDAEGREAFRAFDVDALRSRFGVAAARPA